MSRVQPVPPCLRSRSKPRCKRSVRPKTDGIPAIPPKWRLPILWTRAGETARSSLKGRPAIVAFLQRKWAAELDYRLIKELWAFMGNRIAVRFAYEWHNHAGSWFRSYGNENWEFDASGLMRVRHASINDLSIEEAARRYHWPLGPAAQRSSWAERSRFLRSRKGSKEFQTPFPRR